MPDPYVDFFLAAPADVVQLEFIEISHPDFTTTYRYVRNSREDVTVTIPGEGSQTFVYRPLSIRRLTESDDIDQRIEIDVGDPGEVLPTELDQLAAADSFDEEPVLRYWVYRSDDLTVPLVGPLSYLVRSVNTKGDQATIEAGAPQRNVSSTGELYTFSRFPMLRGFI